MQEVRECMFARLVNMSRRSKGFGSFRFRFRLARKMFHERFLSLLFVLCIHTVKNNLSFSRDFVQDR